LVSKVHLWPLRFAGNTFSNFSWKNDCLNAKRSQLNHLIAVLIIGR